MKKLVPLIVAAILVLVQSSQALTITGFGTGDYNHAFSDFTTTSQTASQTTVIGTDFGSSILGNLAVPVTIGLPASIQLLATFSGTATSQLQIQLDDSTLATGRIYTASLSSFVPFTPTLVTFNLLSPGTFNGTVSRVALITTGTGDSVNLSADTLQVPEPSTALFVGLSLVGAVASRRRR